MMMAPRHAERGDATDEGSTSYVFDFHTHHERCGHAEGTLEDYIESAIDKGLTHIGLSDHSPIYHLGDDPQPLPHIAMAHNEFDSYIDEALLLAKDYRGQIRVRIGVEADYVRGWAQHYRDMWVLYPLDFVIGSVHFPLAGPQPGHSTQNGEMLKEDDPGAWSAFFPELPDGYTVDEVWTSYLHGVQEAANSGTCDIIGHLDVLKTAGHLPSPELDPLIDETLQVISDNRVAIELNTSGWRKPIKEAYPSRDLLLRARQRGVPVTLGSDAHKPRHVAADFDKALALLRDVGYNHLATFSTRRMTLVSMDEL